jgi:hypothetical protein
VAADGTSTVDLSATTTGIKDEFRRPGRATALHTVDLDFGVATGRASTVDFPAMTTGIKGGFRFPSNATALHRVDLDSAVATIADPSQETGDNVEAADKRLSNESPAWF